MHAHPFPKLIAHRGASGEAPENTLSAIQAAIDIGVDCIEFDVRLTKDKIPVVIHDETLLRVTGNNDVRCIQDLTLSQIKSLDVGSWFNKRFAGEVIPTLEEVLLMAANQTHLMIEIKEGPQPPEVIFNSILKAIQRTHANVDSLKFGSFSFPIIQKFTQSAPHLHVMGIAEEIDSIQIFIDNNIKHMALWHQLINPALMRALEDKEISIWTFTVDDPEIAQQLLTLSVQGIITNQPRHMKDSIFSGL